MDSTNPHHQAALDRLTGAPYDLPKTEPSLSALPTSKSMYSADKDLPRTFSLESDQNTMVDVQLTPKPYAQPNPPIPTPPPQSRFEPRPPNKSLFHHITSPSITWMTSLVAILRSSYLNVLLIFVPVAFALHMVHSLSPAIQFAMCFVAMIPLSKLFDYGGEQLALYLGKNIGELVSVTSTNVTAAILCLCLLTQCEVHLLQSTIIGIILLRLLPIPAFTLLAGGVRVENSSESQTLLTTGVLSVILPVAVFSALNSNSGAVNDTVRRDLLKTSRGLAMVLLGVYISSTILTRIPNCKPTPTNPDEKPPEDEPEINLPASMLVLVLVSPFVTVNALFLAKTIGPMREQDLLKPATTPFFGLIALPLCCLVADLITSLAYLIHCVARPSAQRLRPPRTVTRPLETSAQLLLVWTPVLILLAWAIRKPLTMLVDLFEVVVLVGAVFLASSSSSARVGVDEDAQVSHKDRARARGEGIMLVGLYLMVARLIHLSSLPSILTPLQVVAVYFYSGEPSVMAMASCPSSIYDAAKIQGSAANITFADIVVTTDVDSNTTDILSLSASASSSASSSSSRSSSSAASNPTPSVDMEDDEFFEDLDERTLLLRRLYELTVEPRRNMRP
ncbi:H+/Ca2+ exchanger Vxc1-like protein [Mycena kentingensis (nom. inval.)]|nr:H+/Ca2+ exchanger Vxc1-like protein [Mycena kentingensis (nom. inval.)]